MNALYGKTPEELREIIKSYPYPDYVGKCVLEHKNAPIDVLLEHSHVSAVLSNLELPVEVYDKIFNDGSLSLLTHAVRINHTPKWFLDKIYSKYSSEHDVQIDLSRNKSIDAQMLDSLSKSDNWEVRSRVARHTNTSIETVKYLQQDQESRVLISLRERFVKNGLLDACSKTNWKDVAKIKVA